MIKEQREKAQAIFEEMLSEGFDNIAIFGIKDDGDNHSVCYNSNFGDEQDLLHALRGALQTYLKKMKNSEDVETLREGIDKQEAELAAAREVVRIGKNDHDYPHDDRCALCNSHDHYDKVVYDKVVAKK